MPTRHVLSVLLCGVTVACSQIPPEESKPGPDTAPRDTGTATSPGSSTATGTDTGTDTGDTARSDTGATDTGIGDSGGNDTGSDDTGTADTGLDDSGASGDCWDLDIGNAIGVRAHDIDPGLAEDRHAPACALSDGPDTRLRWTAPSEGRWRVAALGTAFDASVTAWSDACADELGCAAGTDAAAPWIELDARAGQAFVLEVDAGTSATVTLAIVSASATEADCTDGVDEDLDGATDCDDSQCATAPSCLAPETCADGRDDDLDGRIDCLDPDCAQDAACPGTETACADGADDDHDGQADCADADCASGPACVEVCGNGVDDGDPDTLADCADSECRASVACMEDCTGSVDEDLDGDVDCEDPDCIGDVACPDGPPPREVCDDPTANDEDGDQRANCDDPDCDTLPSCETVLLPETCDDAGAVDEDGDHLANCADPDCAPRAACGGRETACTDGGDDDGDGRVDCWDGDCDADVACPAVETACADGVDADHDGVSACADSDCAHLAACGGVETACAGGGDEDADGHVDCADRDCDGAPACIEDCADGVDDDGNGDVDCADSDCVADAACQEDCDNGVDDRDADTLADCADPACQGTDACPEACVGGLDEDADGAADCADSDCAPLHLCGGVETTCAGGVDDDADGVTDCWDPDCRGTSGCPALEYVCDDATDDDHDGAVDCDDTDCAAWAVCGGAEVACDNLADDDHDGVVDARDPDCNPDTDGDGWFLRGTFDPITGEPVPGTADCMDDGELGPYVNPGRTADECNGVDEDCDGTIDEDTAYVTYYRDEDADGFGDPSTANAACTPPLTPGWVSRTGDCDDGAGGANVHPGVTDTCDGVDSDCDGSLDDDAAFVTWYLDTDGDGFGAIGSSQARCDTPTGSGHVQSGGDCDDGAADVHPGVTDSCDGVDSDCDGGVDEDAAVRTWYIDDDGDGYGTTASAQQTCAAPAATGWAQDGGDCDDGPSGDVVHPDATDSCDGVDTDCDGTVDDDASFVTWYYDEDGDGYGTTSGAFCAAPTDARWIARAGDCDDRDSAFVDHVYWRDADSDGYGTQATPLHACSASIPAGYAASGDGLHDCYDGADGFTDPQGVFHPGSEFHPGAAELCDDYDQDCDGAYDEGLATTAWYYDADGDGYSGDGYAGYAYTGTYASRSDCGDPGAAWVADTGDCYDTVSYTYANGFIVYGRDFYPGASEEVYCDTFDQDCDGNHYDGTGTYRVQYYDYDGDGYGYTSAARNSCDPPTRVSADLNSDGVNDAWVLQSGDCDEYAASVNPGATDTCDGIDTDCNGQTDDDAATTTFYYDQDGDGHGVAYASAGYEPRTQCADPGTAWVPSGGDCLDVTTYTTPGAQTLYGADFYPGAAETCDNFDQDCDGVVDDGLATQAWYLDEDGDGYGFSTSAYPNASAGHIVTHCRNPGYVDGPGQGYTWQTSSSDCDESSASIHPGRAEICGNGTIDDNCSGMYDENIYSWYRDADGDGYGGAYASMSCSAPPSGYVLNAVDCLDDVTYTHASGVVLSGSNFNPAHPEVCDGFDNNCNGSSDEGLAVSTYYVDTDGDGYGLNPATHPGATGYSVSACGSPGTGWVTNSSDCYDGSAAFSPARPEVCDEGTYYDHDCDGQYDEGCQYWYRDSDGDGYGGYTRAWAMTRPASDYTTATGDCAEWSLAINPGAGEMCNDGVDNNCNGSTDEAESSCYSQCYILVGGRPINICTN